MAAAVAKHGAAIAGAPVPVNNNAAILVMDYESFILESHLKEKVVPFCEKAAKVLAAARAVGVAIIYVVVQFTPDYPQVCSRNKMFAGIAKSGHLLEGSADVAIPESVEPAKGEVVVIKRRVNAFHDTELQTVINAVSKPVTHLVLMGVKTSGVVLSTVRDAADRDYELTILSDLCADANGDLHDVLTKVVFPQQATVTTAAEFCQQAFNVNIQ